MGLFDLFRWKKKARMTEQAQNQSEDHPKDHPEDHPEDHPDPPSSNEEAAVNPYMYNTALFKQFDQDLENNALPEIPGPTEDEIMEYSKRKAERAMSKGIFPGPPDKTLLRENNAIPAEVDIWVDKVYDHYFNSLKPMLGMVHWCEGARKALYRYKGFEWHTASELYPTVHFD